MVPYKIQWIGLSLLIAGAFASVAAQDIPDARKTREVPASSVILPTGPFSANSSHRDASSQLRVIAADAMTSHDRDVAADAESSIRERAGIENLEFNEGKWTYSQIVCPALPNHLLLRFMRDDGTNAKSMFSAAIPRTGEGRVRIIPIVRKGYSLFSPAAIGPITIAAFNRIRAEDNPDHAPDWLMTGMCYAALAGANPQPDVLFSDQATAQRMPLTDTPTLRVEADGRTVIVFDDASAKPRPEQWKLFFDPKGKLLKATHAAYDATRERAVRQVDTDKSVPAPKLP